MIPFRNPQSLHISRTTAESRLSVAAPYCPCIRTLNISTAMHTIICYSFAWGMVCAPGLARTALATPAMAPARAISFRDSVGYGEMIRFEMPYDANKREFTPAIPRRGLAIPIRGIKSFYIYQHAAKLPLYSAKNPSFLIVCFRMSIGPVWIERVQLEHHIEVTAIGNTHKHPLCGSKSAKRLRTAEMAYWELLARAS